MSHFTERLADLTDTWPRCELCWARLLYVQSQTVFIDNAKVVALVCDRCAKAIANTHATGDRP